MSYEMPAFSEASKQNRLMRVFFNADLRCSHKGLFEAAQESGFDVRRLKVGEFVCFVNKKKTGVKMFASGDRMLGYFKMPSHRQINVKVLRILPRFFNGGELRYQAALDDIIRSEIRS